MYRCVSCGKIFDIPKVVSEYVGEFWGTPAYQNVGYCPICGDDEYDEIQDDEVGDDEVVYRNGDTDYDVDWEEDER